jgi:beta-phosphoglucomutase
MAAALSDALPTTDSTPAVRPLNTLRRYRAALFDLDGVIVDTAKYHYLAWKRLAQELGFDFSRQENERLKGVSRNHSLEILLEIGGLLNRFSTAEKAELAARKNRWYVEFIAGMEPSELLPGAQECLAVLRRRGIRTALGTASKNAPLILDRLGIAPWFDAVVDGNRVTKAKPDPEVFLLAAHDLGIPPTDCAVFEDAEAGLQAAKFAGMYAVGIGDAGVLRIADRVVAGLIDFNVDDLF